MSGILVTDYMALPREGRGGRKREDCVAFFSLSLICMVGFLFKTETIML